MRAIAGRGGVKVRNPQSHGDLHLRLAFGPSRFVKVSKRPDSRFEALHVNVGLRAVLFQVEESFSERTYSFRLHAWWRVDDTLYY